MNESTKVVWAYLRRKAIRQHVTPTRQDIAEATGLTTRAVDTSLSTLRKEGVLICEWKKGGPTKRMGVKITKGWRWTKERKQSGRKKDSDVADWGGGRIARLPPVKRDEAINRVFAGRKFESYRFKR